MRMFLLGFVSALALTYVLGGTRLAAQFDGGVRPRQFAMGEATCYTLGTSAISCVSTRMMR